jgi:hypothetical protein
MASHDQSKFRQPIIGQGSKLILMESSLTNCGPYQWRRLGNNEKSNRGFLGFYASWAFNTRGLATAVEFRGNGCDVAAERDDGRAFVPRDDALHGGRIGPGRFGRSETRSKSCPARGSGPPLWAFKRWNRYVYNFFVIVCINWCFVFPWAKMSCHPLVLLITKEKLSMFFCYYIPRSPATSGLK